MYNSLSSLEGLYNRYSALLFGIALQVSPDKESAEEILVLAFQKIYKLELSPLDHASIFITMTRMIIQLAQEKFIPLQAKEDLKLRMFEKSGILCNLLNGSFSIDRYCLENKITRAVFAKQVRQEFLDLKAHLVITLILPANSVPANKGKGHLTVVT